MSAQLIWTSCETRRIRRRSARSARTPPKREKTRNGASPRNASTPSQNGEPVSVRTSHPCATRCIQVPTLETSDPDQRSRKSRWRRGEKARGRRGTRSQSRTRGRPGQAPAAGSASPQPGSAGGTAGEGRGETAPPRLRVRRPLARRLREGREDEGVDLGREPGTEEGGRRRLGGQDLVEDRPDRFRLHEPESGERLPDDRREGVEVGRRGELLVHHLLRRHEGGRPDDHPGPRQRPARFRGLREAEVDDLHPEPVPVARQDEVLGLHVAVDDSRPVGRRERRPRLAGDLGHLRGRAPPLLRQDAPEVPAAAGAP